MKKTITSLLFLSLTINLAAQDLPVDLPTNIYQNIRESKSTLISDFNENEIARLYKGTRSLALLKKIIEDKKINKCGTKIVAEIGEQLNLKTDKDIEFAILGLRLDDSIDDVAANLLIKANQLSRPTPLPFAKHNLTAEEEKKALEIIASKAKDIKNSALCVEDTYRGLVEKLTSESPKFGKALKRINKLALHNNLINESDYKKLEQMRAGKVHEWPLTLSEYFKSLESIAKTFSGRVKESSVLVTDNKEGKFRNKKSLRQSLYEKFNSTQIILLANMVKDLKKRLDAKDVSITIDYGNEQTEIIYLSPMEKFRFVLQLLRKELATINNSSLLNGNKANYIDIITAAYEVGYIGAIEIEHLASLEDIWNPKKTSKEKIMAWGKRFGGIASILLPPPFGFVSVMAIMIIDQSIAESPIDRDPDYDII